MISNFPATNKVSPVDMAKAVRTLILGVDENPDREGLLKTPDSPGGEAPPTSGQGNAVSH